MNDDSSPPPKGPNPDPRRITYRVGWKSGTIHLGESGTQGAASGKSGGTSAMPGKRGKPRKAAAPKPKPLRRKGVTVARTASSREGEGRRTEAYRLAALLLRPAPLPSERAWAVILAALPAASFALLLWLAYRLNS
ncbi:hypothetical protein [Paenibacillus sp.]|uniref:hypothetical protein n=1 Tax=Paenibacillus sp. TaxID=58172 RepID=UPI002D7139C7|nr:hypothetical protein [Paenibacillus sp.]HZG88028.1 hypothetical protein [Paenibacillus sp.]